MCGSCCVSLGQRCWVERDARERKWVGDENTGFRRDVSRVQGYSVASLRAPVLLSNVALTALQLGLKIKSECL